MIKKIVQAIVISLIAKKVTDYLTRDKYPRLALEYQPAAGKPTLLRQKKLSQKNLATDADIVNDVQDAVPEFVAEQTAHDQAVDSKTVVDSSPVDHHAADKKQAHGQETTDKAATSKANTASTNNTDGSIAAS